MVETLCGPMEGQIDAVNIGGRTLTAETRYSSTIVRVRNTGEVAWQKEGAIQVVLGFGDRLAEVLRSPYHWIEKLDRDLPPNQTYSFDFRDFRTPPGEHRWEVSAYLTCGPRREYLKDEWHGHIKTDARYELGLLKPGRNRFEALKQYDLRFGFRNIGRYRLEATRRWGVRSEVQRAPRRASAEDRELFEFDYVHPRVEDLPAGEDVLSPKLGIRMPYAEGDWELKLTLLDGREPVRVEKGNPRLFKFRIDSPPAHEVVRASVEKVSIDDKELSATTTVGNIAVRLRNASLFRWEIEDDIAVVLGTGRDWSDLDSETVGRGRLHNPVDPGEVVDLRVDGFETQLGNARWPLVAFVTCGGMRESRVVAEWKGEYKTKAVYRGRFLPPRVPSMKPGEAYELSYSFVNVGRAAWWSKGDPWVIETKVDKAPSGAKPADIKPFELNKVVDSQGGLIPQNNSVEVEHRLGYAPEVPGDWEIEVTLKIWDAPFGNTAVRWNPGRYRFEIEKPDYRAELRLGLDRRKAEPGDGIKADVTIKNTGNGAFRPGQWSVVLWLTEIPGRARDLFRDTSLMELLGRSRIEPGDGESIRIPFDFDDDLAEESDARGTYGITACLYVKGAGDDDPVASSEEEEIVLLAPG